MGKKITCLFLALFLFTSVAFCYKVYRCYDKLTLTVFEKKFTEPIEVLYLIAKDFTLYRVTSNDELKIEFYMSDIIRTLEKNKHKMSDIIIIIHNHLPGTLQGFSPSDVNAWKTFKEHGFTGNFYVYLQGRKIIYELREE